MYCAETCHLCVHRIYKSVCINHLLYDEHGIMDPEHLLLICKEWPSSAEASIWAEPCRLSPGTDAGSPPSFSGPTSPLAEGSVSDLIFWGVVQL